MNEFVNNFYVSGNLAKMILCEYVRGMSWALGFFTVVIPICVLGIWLFVKFVNRKYKNT